MGMNIKITDANFTKSLGAILPFNNNLVGYWNFSTGLAEGSKNLVTGSTASLIGIPTVVNGALQTDRTKGLMTNLVVNTAKTFITIARYEGDLIFMGTMDYDSAGLGGQDGMFIQANRPRVQVDRATGATISSADSLDPALPYIFAGTIDNAGSDIYAYDGTSIKTATAESTDSQTDANPIRIGGWSVDRDVFPGSAQIYTALVYNRKLSASELETVFAYLKSRSNLFTA